MPRRRKRAEMRVYFQDEVPAIGCGWRFIDIVQRGRKWIRIKEHATGRTARLAVAAFDRLRHE